MEKFKKNSIYGETEKSFLELCITELCEVCKTTDLGCDACDYCFECFLAFGKYSPLRVYQDISGVEYNG